MTTMEIILAEIASIDAQIAALQRRRADLSPILNGFAQIGAHTDALSLACRTEGKAAVYARHPQAVADAINAILTTLQPFWEANSPRPFPPMPDNPESSEPEEPT